jgi:small conductance mechanosensitive channel
VHVIPNGTIQTVSNLTSVWARAIVDVTVAHSAHVDVVLDAMSEVGRRFHEDEAWKDLLLEQPEVVGVMKLTDTSVQLRMQVKVKVEKQWKVQSELLRRLKEELDARAVPMPMALVAPAVGPRDPT